MLSVELSNAVESRTTARSGPVEPDGERTTSWKLRRLLDKALIVASLAAHLEGRQPIAIYLEVVTIVVLSTVWKRTCQLDVY